MIWEYTDYTRRMLIEACRRNDRDQGMALPLDDRRNKQPAHNLYEPFREYATALLGDYPVGRWAWYSSITSEDSGSTGPIWALQPHQHGKPGRTVIHFLQAPESGGELVLFDEEGEITETIVPEDGKTVILEDRVMHGVRKVEGSTERIALIGLANQAQPPLRR